MNNKKFKYDVNLVPLKIPNQQQNAFRETLNNIPYLLYQVEELTTGEMIVINKPGGKRNFGRLSRNDFMVFIYNPSKHCLWLISHKEISDDIESKYKNNPKQTKLLLKGLYHVCCGEEPDAVINRLKIKDTIGIHVETILKTYKWIWGQEDCNYPTQKGRWLSMDELKKRFGLTEEELR